MKVPFTFLTTTVDDLISQGSTWLYNTPITLIFGVLILPTFDLGRGCRDGMLFGSPWNSNTSILSLIRLIVIPDPAASDSAQLFNILKLVSSFMTMKISSKLGALRTSSYLLSTEDSNKALQIQFVLDFIRCRDVLISHLLIFGSNITSSFI